MAARALRLFPDPDTVPGMDAHGDFKGAGYPPAPLNDAPDDGLRDALEAFRATSSPDDVVPLAAGDAAAAGWLTLWEYFERYYDPWQSARVRAKTIDSKSAGNIRTAARQYYAWDSDPARKIDGWPAGRPWTGLPLRSITSRWIEEFLQAKMRGYPAGAVRLAEKTAHGKRNSLGAILTNARNRGVEACELQLRGWKKRARRSADDGDFCADDRDPRIVAYTDEEIGAIYAALPAAAAELLAENRLTPPLIRSPKPKPADWKPLKLASSAAEYSRRLVEELRCLLVLDLNCGARAGDLLRFRFGEKGHVDLTEDPAVVRFAAGKTGKVHWIPLADVTARHLRALQQSRGHDHTQVYLFPHAANPHPQIVKSPVDRGPYTTLATPLLRRALQLADLDPDVKKPVHAIRKACVTRFDVWSAANGSLPIGSEITHGKGVDVVAENYRDMWESLLKAVASIGWPAEFLQN